MDNSIIIQIREAEKQLQTAMLQGNAEALEQLLTDDLIFTNHLGRVMTKADDLAAHRSQSFRIDKIDLSEENIRLAGDCAIVSVRAKINGTFAGQPADGDFRFTRVWHRAAEKRWLLVAGHSCLIT